MSYKNFKGITEYGENPFSTRIELGLIFYLNWAFLNIGGFNNVAIPSSGGYGGYNHRLKPRYSPNYQDGRVWQGFRPNWVWESGVEYPIQPTQFSGVKVNGIFSVSTGIYPHNVDFIRGQVIFNSPVSISGTVEAAFAYKDVLVTDTSEPFVKDFLFGSYNSANTQFFGSGSYSRSSIALPAIAVEVVPSWTSKGLALGGGQMVYQDVLFHIFAESKLDRDKLADILAYQNFSTLMLLNINQMAAQTGFPLTYTGSKAPNAKTFPQLVQDFFWKKGYLRDVQSTASQALGQDLFYSAIRGKIEIEMGEI